MSTGNNPTSQSTAVIGTAQENRSHKSAMQPFWLKRTEDVSGVSGTGIVAEGIIFTSGKVILAWLSDHHTTEQADSIKEIEDLHGHGGRTVIVYALPEGE